VRAIGALCLLGGTLAGCSTVDYEGTLAAEVADVLYVESSLAALAMRAHDDVRTPAEEASALGALIESSTSGCARVTVEDVLVRAVMDGCTWDALGGTTVEGVMTYRVIGDGHIELDLRSLFLGPYGHLGLSDTLTIGDEATLYGDAAEVAPARGHSHEILEARWTVLEDGECLTLDGTVRAGDPVTDTRYAVRGYRRCGGRCPEAGELEVTFAHADPLVVSLDGRSEVGAVRAGQTARVTLDCAP
jgi:hypothetical protein